MSLTHTVSFLRRYVTEPHVVGAIAPSSRQLARALAAPFANRTTPASVLEVGAGTGAVTRAIAQTFTSQDRLDICEIDPGFADTIERDFLLSGPLAPAYQQGCVRLIRGPVQSMAANGEYDFVISGLPFTAFTPEDVEAIMGVISRSLKPLGVFSYFEYLFMRRLMRNFALGAKRKRMQAVSHFLDRQIKEHETGRKTIWWNLPPAYARYWKFTPETGPRP
jgi:phospholipid N-methyltransferase